MDYLRWDEIGLSNRLLFVVCCRWACQEWVAQEQSSDCLVETILDFEKSANQFHEKEIWENALRFDREIFEHQLMSFVLQAWWDFQVREKAIKWGGRRGTIPQPSDPQSDALPIELRPPR